MNKNIRVLVGICLLLVFFSCKQPATIYMLSGKINGLKDGTRLELVPGATHSDEKAVAESTVKDGRFSFTGKQDEPRLFYLRVAGTYGSIPLMLENAKINLTANAVFSESGSNSSVNFSDVQLTGSEMNDLYMQKMAFKDTLNQRYDAYHKAHEAMLSALSQARQSKNRQQIDSIQNGADYKAFAKAEKAFFDRVETTTNRAVMENKDSWWGPLVMLQSMSYFTDGQKPLYESFSQEAKDSYYGKLVYKELFPEKLVGKTVPDFELQDRSGMVFQSSTLMEGKKYVLIDFWASWCAPCRKEIPNLKRIYEHFSGKGLQIISISIDKRKADWLKALDEEKMPWPNLMDDKGIDKQFLVKFIPALFLIDDKGTVIADDLRGEALYKKLEKLF